jgi:hypothetical protein
VGGVCILTDADRRQLAVRGFQVGRRALPQVATIVTPDTLLRWHRQLVAQKWTYARRLARRDVQGEIRRLVVRITGENPTWGYTRIQGALKNVGHRVGRSTIARILKTQGVPPVPERPRSVPRVTSWLDRREREVLACLIEENGLLRRQVGGRRLRLTDEDRRKLAARAYRLGRQTLREVATIVTPDTLLRWHRQIIARKWTYAKQGTTRRGVLAEIRQLVRRMAEENPRWGYTRIQGALKNLGHRVGRSTIARILRADGIPPAPDRPTSWQTFLRAHWGEVAAADFFTTEVWTWQGLVTFYTIFVIELATRRVQILGSTPNPDEASCGRSCGTSRSRTPLGVAC